MPHENMIRRVFDSKNLKFFIIYGFAGTSILAALLATAISFNILNVAAVSSNQGGTDDRASALFQEAARLYDSSYKGKRLELDAGVLCEALSKIGHALEFRPFDARMLLSWANIRQLLASYDCSEPNTSGDFRQALELGLKQDPMNSSIQYEAAKLYLWSKERDKALKVLAEALRYDVSFKAQQEAFIVELLQSPADLNAVLPARLPQIAKWTKLLFLQEPSRSRDFKAALSILQNDALNRAQEDFDYKRIPAFIFAEYLSSLHGLPELEDALRRKLDEISASFFVSNGNSQSGGYFFARAKEARLGVIFGEVSGDGRPQKSVMSHWALEGHTCIDEYAKSTGFYLPQYFKVKYLELSAGHNVIQESLPHLKVYVSDDNQQWRELPAKSRILDFPGLGQSILVYKLEGLSHGYWKLHFEGPRKSPQICGLPSLILRAYGET